MGNEENRYLICFLFIIVISVSSFPLLRSSEAISEPGVYITLVETKILVEHENFNDTSVRINGFVSYQLPFTYHTDPAFIELYVESANFSFSSIPLLVIDPGNRQQDFNFSVLVPFETPVGELYPISVHGRFVNTNLTRYTPIYPASCLISIKQNHSFRINEIESSSIKAGHSHSFRINFTNVGNGADRYRIIIPSLHKLADDGWEVFVYEFKPSIPPGKHHIGTVNIKVPSDEKPGNYEVDFVLESRMAESNGEPHIMENGTIHVEVLNNYRDELLTGILIVTPISIIIILIVGVLISVRRIK